MNEQEDNRCVGKHVSHQIMLSESYKNTTLVIHHEKGIFLRESFNFNSIRYVYSIVLHGHVQKNR